MLFQCHVDILTFQFRLKYTISRYIPQQRVNVLGNYTAMLETLVLISKVVVKLSYSPYNWIFSELHLSQVHRIQGALTDVSS